MSLEHYAENFEIFVERYDGYPVIESWVRAWMQSRESKPRSVLSIGAGDGHYDAALLRHLLQIGPAPEYWALEPNPEVIDALRTRLGAVHDGTRVFHGAFDGHGALPSALARTFDFILMTHCVYFMPHPAQALLRARGLLGPGGHILVHHQGESCLSEAFLAFSPPSGWAPGPGRQDHGMTVQTISAALQQAHVLHYLDERPTWVYVDEFFEDRPSPASRRIVLAMLTFFLDVPVHTWPAARIEQAIAFVRERSERDPATGRYRFIHPEGMIVIPRSGDASIPPGMQAVAG